MSRNPIQLQKGLSLTAFLERYGTEAKCEAAVRAWRWPDGFVCPQCGGRDHSIVGARELYNCHGCRKQTSLKANTIFQRTLLPLTTWFQGMYLLTQSKNSISGLELARQLGVRPDTAALMRHKLMTLMEAREAARKLDGRVEMDDVIYGGEKHEHEGGKRGRGGPNKVPFVVGRRRRRTRAIPCACFCTSSKPTTVRRSRPWRASIWSRQHASCPTASVVSER